MLPPPDQGNATGNFDANQGHMGAMENGHGKLVPANAVHRGAPGQLGNLPNLDGTREELFRIHSDLFLNFPGACIRCRGPALRIREKTCGSVDGRCVPRVSLVPEISAAAFLDKVQGQVTISAREYALLLWHVGKMRAGTQL